jgi:uncharacterized membrane protein
MQQRRADEKFCTTCGNLIHIAAEICPKCGVRQMAAPSAFSISAATSSGALPMWLNGIFGLFGFLGIGHMVAGSVGSGIGLLLAGWLISILFAFTFWFLLGFIFVPLYFVVWIWSIVNVNEVVKRKR